jgi:formate dehydrogenase subunit gamma
MSGAVPWNEARAREIIVAHLGLEGPALPILHALQEEFGCVPEAVVPQMAEALNISRAEMHGVVTFYHDFRREPHGRHTLKLCRAESCRSMGSEKVAGEFLRRLKLEWGKTTPDGALTVEAVYCLGLCAHSPSALYDGEPIGRVDAGKLDDIAQESRMAQGAVSA